MKNWKTSAAGVIAILVPVLIALQYLLDGDEATMPDWKPIVATIPVALMGWFAKDKDEETK